MTCALRVPVRRLGYLCLLPGRMRVTATLTRHGRVVSRRRAFTR